MAYDVPVPSAYAQVVVKDADRGRAIYFPQPRRPNSGRDPVRGDADELGLLDTKAATTETAEALSLQSTAVPGDFPAPHVDKAHPAARLALIGGGSALVWAAIAYGAISAFS